jgi:lipopolysaccharide transport system ATP-binding protein
MSLPVIVAEHVSKRYMIGATRRPDTLRDRLTALAGSARRRLGGRRSASDEAASDQAFWALRDVSFQIQPGEVVGIVGRNGAGKSTLLKILSRITEPTEGRIRMRGRVASLLEVGTGFHAELTGRENIYLNGAILGMSRLEIRRKFDEIVGFADIGPFLDTPVKRYSSGMYVRLAFAVAAHLEPEILIVDEVLAVGDIAFQKKCLGKIQSVSSSEGRTVLFVSHNIDAVRRLCRTAILLSGGRIQAMDETQKVLNLYLHDQFSAEPLRVPAPDSQARERAYVTGVALENLAAQSRGVVAVGEPYQVRITFRACRDYGNFVVGLGFVSADGTPAQTAWTQPTVVRSGDHEALFEQQTFLQAGTYTLVVGLSDSDQSLQQIEAVRFDISAEEPQGHFPMTAGVGMVLNSMRASVRRL